MALVVPVVGGWRVCARGSGRVCGRVAIGSLHSRASGDNSACSSRAEGVRRGGFAGVLLLGFAYTR